MGIPGQSVLIPRGLGRLYFDQVAWYTLTVNNLTVGNENSTPSIPVQSDAHFLMTCASYDNSLEVSGTTKIAGGALISWKDSNGKDLQSAQVPLNTVAGRSGPGASSGPYWLPLRHLFRANAPIVFNITGIGASMAGGVIRIVFGGFKVPIGSFLIQEERRDAQGNILQPEVYI